MKTTNKINVDVSIDKAWQLMADEFNDNDKWMSAVFKTRDTANAQSPDNGARVCEMTPTLDGLNTHEEIVEYDKTNHRLVFTVAVHNGGKLPVKNNRATITMRELGPNKTEVVWSTTPSLKPMGYVLYPILKLGIQKSFREVLEEFKHYVETGQQHPRKVAAMKLMKQ